MQHKIDFSQITEKVSKGKDKEFITSLGGRERGIDARKRLDLDQIENNFDEILFIIPNYISGFHTSFFAGLFSPSINKVGNDRQKFENKYKFQARDIFLDQIDEAIDLCFMNENSEKL